MRSRAGLRRIAVSVLLLGCLAVLLGLGGALAASARCATLANADAPDALGMPGLIKDIRTLTGGAARISLDSETGRARFLGTELSRPLPQPAQLPVGASPEEAARGFLSRYGSLFGLTDQASQISAVKSGSVADGRSFVRFQQVHEGVPVMGAELIVQIAATGNGILSAGGETVAAPSLDINPAVSPSTARENALAIVAKAHGLDAGALRAAEPALWIYNPSILGKGEDRCRLVWRTEVESLTGLPVRELVLVDGYLGFVALHFDQIETAKNRQVYDTNCTATLPGTLVRSEGDGATGNADVEDSYDYTGYTYDFYWTNHGRDSIDDAGMTIVSTVDFDDDGGCDYESAFWDGSQLVFGTGFTSACDVVAHELTHGVTEHESDLFYYMQSGAINEAFSDIWGEFTELTYIPGLSADRWLIGEDLPIGAIRDMKDPTAYGQPDKMTSTYYYCSDYWDDCGGVHLNCGVANKAAYLMADGDSFNGYVVTGMGIPKTADLFYEAQTNLLTSGSDYADLYDALQQAAINLGYGAADRQTVKDAIDAVEMNQQPATCPASEAPVCESGVPGILFSDNMENPASGNWVSGSLSGGSDWFYPGEDNPYGFPAAYATSGRYNFWGYDYYAAADYYMAMTFDVALPAGSQPYLHFRHSFEFEVYLTAYTDGGVVEYSTNGGSTWEDAGAIFTHNGYGGEISSLYGNPLGGRDAFVGRNNGYGSSRVDLGSLAGQSIRFRFRIGTDSAGDALGWFVDDVQIYVVTPSAPVLMYPADGTATSDTTPWLDWSDVSDPSGVHYQLQVDDDAGFSSLVVNKTWVSLSSTTLAVLPEGVYYWRVRAVNGADTPSAWTDAWSFAITPPVPALVYPASWTKTRDNTPWLDWSDVTSGDPPVRYWLQVDDDAGFSSPVVDKNTGAWSSNTLPVMPDGLYYWRVRSANDSGVTSNWSGYRVLGIDTTAPSAPVLVYPVNGKATKDNTPWLDWSEVTDVSGVRYQLQVDDNADFSSPEVNKTKLTCSSTTMPVLADAVYYWRVRAVDGANNAGEWSEVWSITVDTAVPAVAALLYPMDGKVTTDTTPWLDWSDVTDVTGVKYQLQVDNNADFSSPVVNKSGLTLSSRTLSTLSAGTYYWRVRVVDGAGNASAWTAAWSFAVV